MTHEDWQLATLDAIQRLCNRKKSDCFERQELISQELKKIISDTHSDGATPTQTLSRVLQELRDRNLIAFLNRGQYRLLDFRNPNTESIVEIAGYESSTGLTPQARASASDKYCLAVDIDEPELPERSELIVSRIIRDTLIVMQLKDLYEYRCQICGFTIELMSRNTCYCEAHHIRPLGRSHGGTDCKGNIIIVCPNHHAMLDYGAIQIDQETLRTRRHKIDVANIEYHNNHIYMR